MHGSKGAIVFRDPFESDRVGGITDWDEQGWQSLVTDPDVPPTAAKSRPVTSMESNTPRVACHMRESAA